MEDTATEIKDLVLSENEEKESVESTGVALNNLVPNPEEEEEEEEEEGGLVNNFISSLISPKSSPRLRGNIDSKEKGDDLNESDEDLGGGFVKHLVSTIFHRSEEKLGVIDSLVSHLPTPLADDAVPATDEASRIKLK